MNGWPCRIGLTHDAIEVVAESVAYMVAERLGLDTSSDAYLTDHTKDGKGCFRLENLCDLCKPTANNDGRPQWKAQINNLTS